MITDTKEIIKFIPFEPAFKQSLLERYERLQGEEKFALETTIWDAYYQIYEAQLKQNIEMAMTHGNETMDEDFYKDVREKTEKEMEEMIHAESQTSDLSAARSAMEQIIQEIQATKTN